MTKEKIREVVCFYKKQLGHIQPNRYSHDQYCSDKQKALEHCVWMLDEILKFLEEDRKEKVFRWLGFVQGVFWSHSVYKLDSLKSHNMP